MTQAERLVVRLGVLVATIVAVILVAQKCAQGDTRNLLTAAQPADVSTFQVTDREGAVLWRIESARPLRLLELRYGVVPSGFVQKIPPPATAPRPFSDGERLLTKTVMADRVLTHRGVAIGTDGFLGGAWSTAEEVK